MNDITEKVVNTFKGSRWLVISDGIMLIIILIIAGFFYFSFRNIIVLKSDMSASSKVLNQRIDILEAVLASTTITSEELARRLADQQSQSSQLQENIEDISGTVGTLEKLSKTDKELLQKYSRVYFLSDNYVPMSLDALNEKYLYDPTKDLQFHASALSYLERMLSRANRADIPLKIVSAYRSFGTQSALKNSYLMTYGSGSNQFSADQGYSEHQLGTAVDITVDGFSPMLTIGFENTPAFTWLNNNAYKYGFILSYSKNNVYYQYEPWHWRFVGVDLATKLHEDEINFSDMEQREIDTYLVNIFD